MSKVPVTLTDTKERALIPLWRLHSSLHMRSIMWPMHMGSTKSTQQSF